VLLLKCVNEWVRSFAIHSAAKSGPVRVRTIFLDFDGFRTDISVLYRNIGSHLNDMSVRILHMACRIMIFSEHLPP
jgi:hypothetical protein